VAHYVIVLLLKIDLLSKFSSKQKREIKLQITNYPLSSYTGITHYCLTDLTVDSNDITVLVSGEQKHYFHLWGLQKPLVAFSTSDFFRPHS
jgi:hypothetical protein